MAAAALVASLTKASPDQAAELRRMAQLEGGEDGDPWDGLIARAPPCAALSAARTAALRAVGARRDLLQQAAIPTGTPAVRKLAEAWGMVARLRQVELQLLSTAERVIAQ